MNQKQDIISSREDKKENQEKSRQQTRGHPDWGMGANCPSQGDWELHHPSEVTNDPHDRQHRQAHCPVLSGHSRLQLALNLPADAGAFQLPRK